MKVIVSRMLIVSKSIFSKQRTFKVISKDFTVANTRKGRLNGKLFDFPFDFDTIDVSDIVAIHTSLMKKHDIE